MPFKVNRGLRLVVLAVVAVQGCVGFGHDERMLQVQDVLSQKDASSLFLNNECDVQDPDLCAAGRTMMHKNYRLLDRCRDKCIFDFLVGFRKVLHWECGLCDGDDLEACTGNVSAFEVSTLVDLTGQPGLGNEADIAILEGVLRDAYNSVALCDQEGAFITVSKVTIFKDAVDSFGDDIGSGSSARLPFSWLVKFEGTCRGCQTELPSLFDADASSRHLSSSLHRRMEECSCGFPLVETYILECNKLLSDRGGGTSGLFDFDSIATLGSGGGTFGGPSSPFISYVTVSGRGEFWNASPVDKDRFGQVVLETYNALNALNPTICDEELRIIVSVVPDSDVAPDEGEDSPFSVVFKFTGVCDECGEATVLFGDHEPGATRRSLQDIEFCPNGAEFRCPSEAEFRAALQDTIDRLHEEDILTPISNITHVDQVPGGCNDVPNVTESIINLSNWTTEDTNGDWQVDVDDLSVLQKVNGNPTFFCSDFSVIGNDLAGVIRIETASDDDYVGFALGYTPGDATNTNADFILIDWKRGTQSTGLGCGGSVVGEKGLVVSRVTGIPARAEYWKRDNLTCAESQGAVVQLAQGATLNSTGWVRNMDYTFRFVYTEGKFQLFVDDVLQATLSGSFPGGRFCFYNFSQASVRYSGLSRNIIISAPCPS